MHLYLARRTDTIRYDEHDSVVVRAENLDDAIALVNEMTDKSYTDDSDEWDDREGTLSGFTPDNFIVNPLRHAGMRSIVLASFNAG